MNIQKDSTRLCTKQPPAGYVRLADIAPGIVQDMRYAGAENFLGRPVPGYRAPCCWLRQEAAAALKAAHEEAAARGTAPRRLRLLPPAGGDRRLPRLVARSADQKMKAEYYPHLDKKDLFELGYIARQSTHTTGLAVDLAFEGLDFGTPFDLFDEKSNTADPRVIGAARQNRDRLVALMVKHGFENLPNEWWHFTYRGVSDPMPVDFEVV